jgi:monofunctional biosynthetic peptidoglycan transglycosylase
MKKLTLVVILSLSIIGFSISKVLGSLSVTDILDDPQLEDRTLLNMSNQLLSKNLPSEKHTKNMPNTTQNTVSFLPGIEIFSFNGNEPNWYTVDDDVMGGMSSSTVDILEPNILAFSGTMSLANNGGFSSVRSEWQPLDLRDYDGVLLSVYGDGKYYRLRIRSATTGGDISYNAIFETTANSWELIYIPFTDMVPTYRGFVMNVAELDTANIGSFGFMLSDKQPGEFDLQVDWMRAISQEDLPIFGYN